MVVSERLIETVTLGQAKALIKTLAPNQSILLLSPPGVGKSDTVASAAAAAGLPCRSLLGTQIAPEDVSGIPRIVGERAVFCPPRVLLPETPEPFCLFLDELPACSPDIQKAFYALLLDRRIGEFALPPGTWVVAAGNRLEDRALVRSISSALINRVIVLNVRVDVREWLAWASTHGVRSEILAFIVFMGEALMRPVPAEPVSFSTPRSWVLLSRALDDVERAGLLTREVRRALAFGRVSGEDAAVFCAMAEERIEGLLDPLEYVRQPDRLPTAMAALWLVLCLVRERVKRGEMRDVPAEVVSRFLMALPQEHRFVLLVDLVPEWAALGAEPALIEALEETTGVRVR